MEVNRWGALQDTLILPSVDECFELVPGELRRVVDA